MSPTPHSSPTEGRLLALLSALLYGLFTLLPNSSGLMVSWPFVFIWQVALLTPILWSLWQVGQRRRLQGLGQGLDGLTILALGVFLLNGLTAQFVAPARWYAWASLGFIAALYALNGWLTQGHQPEREERRRALLHFQGYLSGAFIVVSLMWWTGQTLIPQLQLLAQFKSLGVNQSFSFNNLELRNWAPLGHQNYVAGYLVLVIPLLVLFTLLGQGTARWWWGTVLALGLLDLYTTSSRGGLLALGAMGIFTLIYLALNRQIPKGGLGVAALGLLGLLLSLVLTNDRLKSSLLSLGQGQGFNELSYRLLNITIGWEMGKSHPFTGIGLGNVPWLYQKYRPLWAGRESEFAYQLHSTPAQLWAELGLGGVALGLGFLIWLLLYIYRWQKNSATPRNQEASLTLGTLTIALGGYGIMALTDYQLDNLAISGTLVIYTACLLSYQAPATSSPSPSPWALPFFYGGLTVVLIALIALFPIHRAWQLSNIGFQALAARKYPAFEQYLSRAQKLAPWEAYYPWQMGWNLGNLALTEVNLEPKTRQGYAQRAISHFQQGIKVSPYLEFGHNNLGWLQLSRNSPQASESFEQGLRLLPAKRGLFFALGLSFLAQQKPDLALEAFSLECLRDPLFITSPLWRSPGLAPFYPSLLKKLPQDLGELRQAHEQDPHLAMLLAQIQGGMYWWQGDWQKAGPLIEKYGTPTAKFLLAWETQPAIQPDLALLPAPVVQVIGAWRSPRQREQLLTQAWVGKTNSFIPSSLLAQLTNSMAQSSTWGQWLRQKAPALQYRRQRLGFGISMRHIDGPNPQDFYQVVENLPLVTWFEEILPSPVLEPAWDLALQPRRERLWRLVNSPIGSKEQN